VLVHEELLAVVEQFRQQHYPHLDAALVAALLDEEHASLDRRSGALERVERLIDEGLSDRSTR
jgi:hypothetical protein